MDRVPSLDLRRFETDRNTFVSQVGDAYRTLGFCTFSNHGIDPVLISNTYEAFQNFFRLDTPTKMRYWSASRSGKRGYTPYKVETAKSSQHPDLKEFFHIGREIFDKDHPYQQYMLPNIWPFEAPGLYTHAWPLYLEMEKLGKKILSSMALAIDLPERFFEDVVSDGNSILRGLHYPPISSSDAPCVRAEAHEDISLITLLLGAQGGGLEILSSDGNWIPVKTTENEIVVNVGDMMQRLTNHVYVSTTHRVINPEGENAQKSRYSIPFFLDPNPDYMIKTLPQCISENNPNRYPDPITANDYLLSRLAEIKVSK